MANIKGLHDGKSDDRTSDNEEDFAGGQRSALAVRYPKQTPKTLRVFLYKNGFRVDGNPFVPLAREAREVFLEAVRAGVIPDELVRFVSVSAQDLPVELVDNDENFDVSKLTGTVNARESKNGSGALYSGTGTRVSSSSESRPHIPVAEILHPEVDNSQPVTSIQIRLPGGSRATRVFNRDSIGLVLLNLALEALGKVDPLMIVVSSGFPPVPLSIKDLEEKTVEDLGLCNSVVSISFI